MDARSGKMPTRSVRRRIARVRDRRRARATQANPCPHTPSPTSATTWRATPGPVPTPWCSPEPTGNHSPRDRSTAMRLATTRVAVRRSTRVTASISPPRDRTPRLPFPRPATLRCHHGRHLGSHQPRNSCSAPATATSTLLRATKKPSPTANATSPTAWPPSPRPWHLTRWP